MKPIETCVKTLAFLAAFCTQVVLSQSPFWRESGGPYGGDVRVFSIDPSGKIFAGLLWNGVFRSTDNGQTWVAKNTGLTDSNVVAVSVDSLGYVYAGTAWNRTTGKVFRSTNDGESWTNLVVIPGDVTDVKADPRGNIFVGYNKAIAGMEVYRSTDNGSVWNSVLFDGGDGSGVWLAILGRDTIIASTGKSIHRSIDNGTSWTTAISLPDFAVSLVSSNRRDVFVGTAGGSVYRSTDAGQSWQPVNTGLQESVLNALAISPQGALLAVGNKSLYRSTNSGVDWQVLGGIPKPFPLLPPVKALAFDAVNGILVGNRGGGFRSSDNGVSWRLLPLVELSVSSIVRPGISGPIVVAADIPGVSCNTSSLYSSTDGGVTWIFSKAGYLGRINAIMSYPPANLFAGGGLYCPVDENLGISYVSTDGGSTWTDGDLNGRRVTSVAVGRNGTLLSGTEGFGIQGSSNVGLTNRFVTALDESPDGLVFAGTDGGGIYRSTDAGTSWTPANDGLTNTWIMSVAHYTTRYLYAGTNSGGGVYRTTDKGQTWFPSGLSSLSIHYLAVSSDGQVFAGTDSSGIFRTTDQGMAWSDLNSGLRQNEKITALSIGPDGYLYAGTTHGIRRSVLPMSAPLPPLPNVPEPVAPRDGSGFGVPYSDTTVALRVSWRGVAGADSFQVQASTESSFSRAFVDTSVADTSIMLGPLRLMPGPWPKVYYWHVNASNVVATTAYSPMWRFFLSPYLPNAARLIAPLDSATIATDSVRFVWHADRYAPLYRLRVATDSSFVTIIAGGPDGADTARTVWGLERNHAYWWRVQVVTSDQFFVGPFSETRFFTKSTTGVTNEGSKPPSKFSLNQNYPNPFNPATTISFSLPQAGFATLKIFNLMGEEVTTLISKNLLAGDYSVKWDGTFLPSGVYFYRLQTGAHIETKKAILQK